MIVTASIYVWLKAQGLWPSSVAALVYWAIPIVAAFVLGKRVLGRLLKPARAEWCALVAALKEHTEVAKVQNEHLATIAEKLPAKEEQ